MTETEQRIREFTRTGIPSEKISELVNKFDGSHGTVKKDKKLCGKNKDRDRIEELIEGFIKLILNDLTIVLD